MYSYVDVLATLDVKSAHPGGLELTKLLLSKEDITVDSRILDAGCGTGKTTEYLAETYGCRIDAIDQHSDMVTKARSRLTNLEKVFVKKGSIEKLPYGSDLFDIILAESVMAFLHNKQIGLAELKRVLMDTGSLIMNEMALIHPLKEEDKKIMQRFYDVPCLYSREEWTELLKKAGFSEVSVLDVEKQLINNKNLVDMSLDKNIDGNCLDILDEHLRLADYYKEEVGFLLFRCKN
ncbi:class I SAM-dependent methyltransferase [Salipaludibacillus sp. HK11]|uniref:class I SAM-dependent methyltransferase n=1 Tax=Salipaludibacillus sp. HK11 TaxID=3394320 RepID=UPI0039FBFA9E